ncbi:DUF423 domain-containing protein [Limnohabitans sp. 15K]|uniref:DUF423 domain-containing protein n=1 Tax=Limnohabitans sp. 15K TaxID=1100706 RepID=UPI000C1F921E|nr:DUF423 domain-containing protein [Limnohabitans sp. 15K]PIT81858.1 hypothetical protein B9Z40_09680 [Limnohabitans sp. 15K]
MSQLSTPVASPPNPKSFPFSGRLFLSLGALSACTSVAFSAAFAHLPVFSEGVPSAVQTALSQQQFHSLGLLFTGLAIAVFGAKRWLQAAGWLMVLGLFFFSFNLYARYVLGLDAFRSLVPWGGGAWMGAWLCLAFGVIGKKDDANRMT